MFSTPPVDVVQCEVVGIATVEIGGRGNFFDCISDINNGSGLVWTRKTFQHRFNVVPIPGGSSPGKRLEMESITSSDLDVYTCSDRYSYDNVSINITDGEFYDTVSPVDIWDWAVEKILFYQKD